MSSSLIRSVRHLIGALLLAPASGLLALDLSAELPHFAYPDAGGELRSVEEWAGRSLIVNFWAPWCGPCRKEIPELVEVADELDSRGFTVVGVALDKAHAVKAFLDAVPVNYPVLITSNASMTLPQQFSEDILGLPATVFSSDDGRLVWGRAGALHGDEIRAVAARVIRVNEGKLTIEEARVEIDTVLAEMAAARLLQGP